MMSFLPSLYRSVMRGVAYTEEVACVIQRTWTFWGHSPSVPEASSVALHGGIQRVHAKR
jgi:hypothetical protein